MPVPAITMSAAGIDLTPRLFKSTTVAASPSGASETTICTLTINQSVAVVTAVYLFGYAGFTVGTNGVSVNLKIRQTDTSGTTLGATGATTATAANLGALCLLGVDTSSAGQGQVYVLTMTVASGSATSTVSNCGLFALVV